MASGVVVHALDTVSWVAVLAPTSRCWPTPVPPVRYTVKPRKALAVHALVVSVSVVAVADVAVPLALAAGAQACTVTWKVWMAPGFIHPKVQVTVPVPPTAGVVQVAPGGAESETKVVFGGSTSSAVASGTTPVVLFSTVKVYVRSVSTLICDGAVLLMERPGNLAPKPST